MQEGGGVRKKTTLDKTEHDRDDDSSPSDNNNDVNDSSPSVDSSPSYDSPRRVLFRFRRVIPVVIITVRWYQQRRRFTPQRVSLWFEIVTTSTMNVDDDSSPVTIRQRPTISTTTTTTTTIHHNGYYSDSKSYRYPSWNAKWCRYPSISAHIRNRNNSRLRGPGIHDRIRGWGAGIRGPWIQTTDLIRHDLLLLTQITNLCFDSIIFFNLIIFVELIEFFDYLVHLYFHWIVWCIFCCSFCCCYS